jgi:hypothetical protein
MPRVINLANITQFAATSLSDPGYLPGPRIIPNACQIVLNWSIADGKGAHNIMYANYTGSPPITAAMAEQVRAALTTGANWTALAAFLAPTTGLASVTLLDVRSSTATAFQSTGGSTPGTSAATALPDETAAVLTVRTGLRGPSGRGRIYIPGWASNAVGPGGTIIAAAVTALGTWGGITLPQVAIPFVGIPVLGHPHRQAYTSPVTGRHFDDRPAGTVPVSAVVVRDNHWDSQRRRGLK